MMHFIPDCLVPGVFSGKRRQYLKECVSLFLFFAFCAVYSYSTDDACCGLMPDWWTKNIVPLIKPYPCPFCGGTRSFLYMFRGEFSEAAHYSFFGIFFFFFGGVDIICKMIYLFLWPAGWFEKFFALGWNCTFLTTVLLSLWCIQLLRHAADIFQWYPFAVIQYIPPACGIFNICLTFTHQNCTL